MLFHVVLLKGHNNFSRMRRIDGNFGPRDVEEDKKRSRDAVLGTFLIFGMMIAAIKIVPYVLRVD